MVWIRIWIRNRNFSTPSEPDEIVSVPQQLCFFKHLYRSLLFGMWVPDSCLWHPVLFFLLQNGQVQCSYPRKSCTVFACGRYGTSMVPTVLLPTYFCRRYRAVGIEKYPVLLPFCPFSSGGVADAEMPPFRKFRSRLLNHDKYQSNRVLR